MQEAELTQLRAAAQAINSMRHWKRVTSKLCKREPTLCKTMNASSFGTESILNSEDVLSLAAKEAAYWRREAGRLSCSVHNIGPTGDAHHTPAARPG
jgi:hypothetical protein